MSNRGNPTSTPEPSVRRVSFGPQPGFQTQFLSSTADIVLGGGAAGAGKTRALLYEPLRHVKHVPTFGGVLFRRELTQIEIQGGLLDESKLIYPYWGAVYAPGDHRWDFPRPPEATWDVPNDVFPTIKFDHLVHEEKTHLKKQGAQWAFIGVDEATHFTKEQIFYLWSRMRNMGGIRSYMRMTCNPDPDHFLCQMIEWWLHTDDNDPETYGYPRKERAGLVRYFINQGETGIQWADADKRHKLLRFINTNDLPEGVKPEDAIKSFTFIPGTIKDNPALLKGNPSYYGWLLSLDYVQRMQLLGGNWLVRPTAGKVFPETKVTIVDFVPHFKIKALIRYWDKAGTSEKEAIKKLETQARSAGVLMGLTTDDQIFVRHGVAGHWGDIEREEAILNTASRDGREIAQRFEQEPGSGGKRDAAMTVRMLGGYDAGPDIPGASKEVRQRAYAAQWQAGNVIIEKNSPTHGAWDWRGFLNEHVAVPQGKIRDYVDAASGAYNLLILGEGMVSYDSSDYATVRG